MTSKYNINANTIHSVGDGNQIYIDESGGDLGSLLEQALGQLPTDSALHAALGDLQRELAAGQSPSSETTSRLEQARQALSYTDKAAGIAHKVVGTLVKLGVLGVQDS